MFKTSEDPEYRKLLNKIEKTFFTFKSSLRKLRNYHFNEEVNELKSAMLQNEAHDAEHQYYESLSNLSKFSWEIVPHSKDPEHLDSIKMLKEIASKRIENKKEPKTKFYCIVTRVYSNESDFV